MKNSRLIIFVFILGACLPNLAVAVPDPVSPEELLLKGVNAKKALQVANQWRWNRREIKSYINTREVVFTFPNEHIKKIPLPENEVMVAVAPYIQKTHE